MLRRTTGLRKLFIMTIPPYRLSRMAEEEAAWQRLKNVFRRLLGLPVIRTGEDASLIFLADCLVADAGDVAGRE